MVKRVENLEGVKLSSAEYADALASGVEQLEALQAVEGRGMRRKMALASSVHSFNLLMTAAETICQRSASQPDAEIDLVTDANGRLIYRCRHDPSHEWDLDGNVIK